MRNRIEELAEELARAEERVSRLAIAGEEVTRVLEEPATAGPAAGSAGEPRLASPIGAVTVPPWQEGTEASALPRSHSLAKLAAVEAARGSFDAAPAARSTPRPRPSAAAGT